MLLKAHRGFFFIKVFFPILQTIKSPPRGTFFSFINLSFFLNIFLGAAPFFLGPIRVGKKPLTSFPPPSHGGGGKPKFFPPFSASCLSGGGKKGPPPFNVFFPRLFKGIFPIAPAQKGEFIKAPGSFFSLGINTFPNRVNKFCFKLFPPLPAPRWKKAPLILIPAVPLWIIKIPKVFWRAENGFLGRVFGFFKPKDRPRI